MNVPTELNRLFGQDPAVMLENLEMGRTPPPRLQLGPYRLSLARMAQGVTHWALPGGAILTYGECGRLALRRGWPRPALVPARSAP